MTEKLRIEYVPLQQAQLWDRNPKRHDLDALRASIKKHGFKDPPKYEPVLNNGEGGLVEGNGRTTVLLLMQKEGEKLPRGIAEDEGGDWAMPVIFGVDSASEKAAEAYGIDHNQLTVAGSALRFDDYISMWDDSISEMITDLSVDDQLPVSIPDEDLDRFSSIGEQQQGEVITTPRDSMPISALVSNDYGIRAMTENEFNALKKSMETIGQLQPVIIRPIGRDKYEIVDGRQRWKAAKELGWKFMDVTVKDLDDTEARMMMITLNKLNGKLISNRMAKTLNEVRSATGDSAVSDVIGIDKNRMNTYQEKPSYGQELDEDGVPERTYKEYTAESLDPIGAMITLLIPMPAEDYEVVEEALNEISTDWAEALLQLVIKGKSK